MKNRSEILSQHTHIDYYPICSRHIMHELDTLLSKIRAFGQYRVSHFSMSDLEQPHDIGGDIDVIRRSNAWDAVCHNIIRKTLSDTLSTLVLALGSIFQIQSQNLSDHLHFIPEFKYEENQLLPNDRTTYLRLKVSHFDYTNVSIREIFLKIQTLYRLYVSASFLRQAIRSSDPSCVSTEQDILFFLNNASTFKQLQSEFERMIGRFLAHMRNFLQIDSYINNLKVKIDSYKLKNTGHKDQQTRVLALEFLIQEMRNARIARDRQKTERCFLLLSEYVDNIKSGKDYFFGVSVRTVLFSKTWSLQKILNSPLESTQTDL